MKYTHTFRTKLTNDETVQTTVTFDYTNVPEKTLLEWATSNRVIALQRVMRSMSATDAIAAYDGKTLVAASVGKKVKTREERIAELINAGVSREVATMIVDNPELVNGLINNDNNNE